jgi:uncharacterized protein YndB with AHSA1/START domain
MNRLLLAIVFVISTTLLVLWMIGGQTVVNTCEVTIAAPPKTVFRYLTDPENVMKWMDSVMSIEPLTEGGHGIGARARITVQEGSRSLVMYDEVLQSEPGRLLEVRSVSNTLQVNNSYELEARGQETVLRQTMKTDYKSWARIFAPLLSGQAERQLQADFQRLKDLIEVEQLMAPAIEPAIAGPGQ